MPLTVIVGGQFGGEGKGLITAYLAVKDAADLLVKIGGPNSSHTFGANGKSFRVRMIPSGANLTGAHIVFPAGSLINVDCLFEEITALGVTSSIFIDPNAGIVDSSTVCQQQSDEFYTTAGSTLTGTGYASSKRSLRRLGLARHEPRLKPYLADTVAVMRATIARGGHVIAEGAQAFGLSNYHGEYPFVSSRDTTVGSALAQMGLGPGLLSSSVLVIKCFPTRNQGGTGCLLNELPYDFLERHRAIFDEQGGGSYGLNPGSRRRAALFDFDIVDRAVTANTPSVVALTGVDRLRALIREPQIASHYGTPEQFIHRLEQRYQLPVGILSAGRAIEDVSDFRSIRSGAAESGVFNHHAL